VVVFFCRDYRGDTQGGRTHGDEEGKSEGGVTSVWR